MTTLRRFHLVVFVTICTLISNLTAQSHDSIASRQSVFIIPHASYQQETSFAPGVAYGYYFKSADVSKISSVSGSVVYTFRNQFLFNLSPKLFFRNTNWYLYSNFNSKYYPDFYFGVGSVPTNTKIAITSRSTSILLQPQYIVANHFYLGFSLAARWEDVVSGLNMDEFKRLNDHYGNQGWMPYRQLTVGSVVAYDSRDNQFYPRAGFFCKMQYSFAHKEWLSTYTLNEFSLDLRRYTPVFYSHLFACQFYFAVINGPGGVPFQMLQTIGGRDIFRSFRQGMYRGNLVYLLQSEYRMPLYKRLKGALFLTAGDVQSNVVTKNSTKLKLGYGAGLRYRINDARVHLRFDLAKNNYGDKLQYYVTATEAF